jgi:glycosyltransferase involved in cell wall biosynthesis
MNCRNGERFLAQAIDSVHDQTFDDWEIVFWDNQSTDRSAEIARSYPRVRYCVSEDLLSLGTARNAAVVASRGELLAFLDSDDAWLPEFLQTVVQMIDADPKVALAYTDAYTINEDGVVGAKYWTQLRCVPSRGSVLEQLLLRNPVILSASALRRAAFDRVKGFRDYQWAEEYDLWLRVAHESAVEYNPSALALYRIHDASLSSRLREEPLTERVAIYDRWAHNPDVPPHIRRTAAGARTRMRWLYSAWLAEMARRAEALSQLSLVRRESQSRLLRLAVAAATLPGTTKATLWCLRTAQRHRRTLRRVFNLWYSARVGRQLE